MNPDEHSGERSHDGPCCGPGRSGGAAAEVEVKAELLRLARGRPLGRRGAEDSSARRTSEEPNERTLQLVRVGPGRDFETRDLRGADRLRGGLGTLPEYEHVTRCGNHHRGLAVVAKKGREDPHARAGIEWPIGLDRSLRDR